MVKCFLCDREFEFGHGRYYGRNVPEWDITICRMCDAGNHDGIVLECHPKLRAHLEAKGITIELNAKGWLDIPR